MTRKFWLILALAVGGALVIACGGSDPAPRNNDTIQSDVPSAVDAVDAVPVIVTGSGESVKTVELVDSGYTVAYESGDNCLIVSPVQADGSDGISVVNECNFDGALTGTTTFNADGPVTLHVWNTNASWSLTFTPLH